MIKPFLKWAGGKTQLLPELTKLVPKHYNKYIEPFFGGGALFFNTQPHYAILSDSNCELINLYKVVRDHPNKLLKEIISYKVSEKEYYYFRELDPNELKNVQRAARTLYLNKTCYNGLFRVNKKGKFNVPYGKNNNKKFIDEENILRASKALKNTEILCSDYIDVLEYYAKEGDFIYLDPPYYPNGGYSDFQRYTQKFFYEQDHIELKNIFDKLVDRGCIVVLTNSDSPFVNNLFKDYEKFSVPTKRLISCNTKTRTGFDLIVHADHRIKRGQSIEQFFIEFPGSRYMGSKYRILPFLYEKLKDLKFDSALDAFSGSSSVSYLLKKMNKKVFSNDYLKFASLFATSLIENQQERITTAELKFLLQENKKRSTFVSDNFKGLYFQDSDNEFIDNTRSNIEYLVNDFKKAIALSALVRACMKKRPRGIFTYTGERYDDGRKDIQMTLKEHFLENILNFNNAVFNNGKNNQVFNTDVFNLEIQSDLVYLDPPYLTPHSDNDYTRRYHFVEGLVKRWDGLELIQNTKTKKFKKYPSAFDSKQNIESVFNNLFEKFKNSTIVLSYSSNSLPTKEVLLNMLKVYKKNVYVEEINLTYSFGNQSKNVDNNANRVKEYLFIAT